ncbi:hypothetical protein Pmani_013078 [Petrolisthes manimaculis]|uniref:Uncharacterized protein n=1 Tax=Petrolisthes manimaculis TaxID=1843537 RepID=A0AAE1UEF4_9EUCA|nr:hypothetical protein Pmani_013078 [Petrolisthes manimaculis]
MEQDRVRNRTEWMEQDSMGRIYRILVDWTGGVARQDKTGAGISMGEAREDREKQKVGELVPERDGPEGGDERERQEKINRNSKT